eukprot:g71283.t1
MPVQNNYRTDRAHCNGFFDRPEALLGQVPFHDCEVDMEDDVENETSVADVYCVVYVLKDDKWHHQEGWSQVLLYKDKSDGSHRIVGFTVQDFEVVINCNIGPTCKYTKKSADFHKLVDEEGTVYGFGFYKKEKALLESEKFMACVLEAIGNDESESQSEAANTAVSPDLPTPLDGPAGAGGGGPASPARPTSAPTAERDSTFESASEAAMHLSHRGKEATAAFQEIYDEEKRMVKLGKLKILPPRKPKNKNGKKEKITSASHVTHVTHVKFDHKTRTYEGLPPEWAELMNRQFGVNFTLLDRVEVPGYKSKLPQVLEDMKNYLIANAGLEQEGVFRLAPDQEECASVKKKLNEGKFEGCKDVHCISNLIKVWFRDLPTHVLSGVDRDAITNCTSPSMAGQIVNEIPEPTQSLILWILDLCALVAANSEVNKMTPKNLAIVIGPNLFSPHGADPMQILKYSQKVARWLQEAIVWRQQTKPAPAQPARGLVSFSRLCSIKVSV